MKTAIGTAVKTIKNQIEDGVHGVSATEEKDEHIPATREPQKQGASSGGIFVAVVLGIIVAVWLISQIFHVEITGTITPLK